MAPLAVQPACCPQCSNTDLARYQNSASCARCGWSNAVVIDVTVPPPDLKPVDGIRAWLLKLWVHLTEQVSVKAKCPACGHRTKHEIKWVPNFGKVLHFCAVCKATWGESPLVLSEAWAITINEQPRQETKSEKTQGS